MNELQEKLISGIEARHKACTPFVSPSMALVYKFTEDDAIFLNNAWSDISLLLGIIKDMEPSK